MLPLPTVRAFGDDVTGLPEGSSTTGGRVVCGAGGLGGGGAGLGDDLSSFFACANASVEAQSSNVTMEI